MKCVPTTKTDRILIQSFYGKKHLEFIENYSDLSLEEITEEAINLGCEREGYLELSEDDKRWLLLNFLGNFKEIKDRLRKYRFSTIYKEIKRIKENQISNEELREIKDDFEVERYVGEKPVNKVDKSKYYKNRGENDMKVAEKRPLTQEEKLQIIKDNIGKSSEYLKKHFGVTHGHVGYLSKAYPEISKLRKEAAAFNIRTALEEEHEPLEYSVYALQNTFKEKYPDQYFGTFEDIKKERDKFIREVKQEISDQPTPTQSYTKDDLVLRDNNIGHILGSFNNSNNSNESYALVIGDKIQEGNLESVEHAEGYFKCYKKYSSSIIPDAKIVVIKEVKKLEGEE